MFKRKSSLSIQHQVQPYKNQRHLLSSIVTGKKKKKRQSGECFKSFQLFHGYVPQNCSKNFEQINLNAKQSSFTFQFSSLVNMQKGTGDSKDNKGKKDKSSICHAAHALPIISFSSFLLLC